MKKIQLYSVIACAALTLFCGCIDKSQGSDSSLTTEITTVTESPVTTAVSTAEETTKITTAISTSIETTITTATSTEVHTTEPEETTVTTTEARVYEHHYEIMNTAFRTRPVNKRCIYLYEKQSKAIYDNVRGAIEENREVYGQVTKWCVDEVNNCIYTLVAYNRKCAFDMDLAIYKIDLNTGDISWVLDTAGPDEDRYPTTYKESDVDVFLMAYGKLIYIPQHGVYYADEENHCLQVIEQRYCILTDDIVPFENKLYIDYSVHPENSYVIHMNEVYDPTTHELDQTDINVREDFDNSGTILNLYCDWLNYSSLKFEGDTSGEHKIIFEWDTFELPD